MFQFTQPKRAATRGFAHRVQQGSRFQFTQPKRAATVAAKIQQKDILSKDKSRKSLLVIILDEEAKAVGLEPTDNQALRNSNKIMFTWGSQPKIFV